jgi:hypothetical protein
MRKMARSIARRISLTGLLVILTCGLAATPAPAKHRRGSAHAKAPASIGYAAPGTGLVLPNGEDNPNVAPVIVSCDPGSDTGTIRTTLQLGSPGLDNRLDPSRDYALYTIHLSAKTQIWVSGDAGKPYEVQSLCPLKEYDPHSENETTYKNLESATFSFSKSRHAIKNAQQFFNASAPSKVRFYVSGDNS